MQGRPSSVAVAAVLLALAASGGCGGPSGPSGAGACEPCRESSDCEAGLTCQQFRDADNGNPRNLCGDDDPATACASR